VTAEVSSNVVPFNSWGRRVSPADLRNHIFPRTPLGRRGYDEDEVDRYRERVARDYECVVGERDRALDERDRYRDALQEWHVREERADPRRAREDAVRLLSAAQRQADGLVADAQRVAALTRSAAQQQYDEIIADAYTRAELAAAQAVKEYRAQAGAAYSPEHAELHRRVTMLRTMGTILLSAHEASRAVLGGLDAGLDDLLRDLGEEVDGLTQPTYPPH
jgi:DivIVA domain-containing protein